MPKKRLNLTVDRAAYERARRYSEGRGTSLSSLVDGFFEGLPEVPKAGDEELSPAVRRLRGVASGAQIDRDDYRRFLADKHGL